MSNDRGPAETAGTRGRSRPPMCPAPPKGMFATKGTTPPKSRKQDQTAAAANWRDGVPRPLNRWAKTLVFHPDGSFTYRPKLLSLGGTDTFTYRASDGTALSKPVLPQPAGVVGIGCSDLRRRPYVRLWVRSAPDRTLSRYAPTTQERRAQR